MSFFDNPITLKDAQESPSFDPVPPGEYTAVVKSAEMKDTKAGDGKYIKLRLDITGPTHTGRVLFSNVTVKNKTAQAETIGRGQLAAILASSGLAQFDHSDQMIGVNVAVDVIIKDDPTYGRGNEVKRFKPLANMPKAAVATSAPASAAKAGPGAAPFWAKPKA